MSRRYAPAHILALCALAYTGCTYDTMPEDTRAPTPAEWVVLDDARTRWEARDLPTLDDGCQAFLGRTLILEADRETCLRECWRDEPGRCAAGESMSKYGCKAGCAIVGSRTRTGWPSWSTTYTPVVIVWEGFAPDDPVRLNLIHHEAVHHLAWPGPCPAVPGSGNDHSNEALWGPDGVHPL